MLQQLLILIFSEEKKLLSKTKNIEKKETTVVGSSGTFVGGWKIANDSTFKWALSEEASTQFSHCRFLSDACWWKAWKACFITPFKSKCYSSWPLAVHKFTQEKKGALHTFPNWTFCSLNLKKDKSCFVLDLQTYGCRIRSNGLSPTITSDGIFTWL